MLEFEQLGRRGFVPHNKNVALFELKAIADDNFSLIQMVHVLFDYLENIAGNGENAGNQHFLLFPPCFLP